MSLPLTAEQREWAQSQAHAAGFLFFAEFIEPLTAAPEPETSPPELWEIKREPNPCVRLFGLGPEGVTCRHCKHLIRHKPGCNTYLKCFLRGVTNGPGTDHKAGWKACKKFEAS
jgi:hypothetical protein